MPIWVNDRCVMGLPIVKPGSLANATKMKALSREPGNPGWIVSPVRRKLLFMGDLDDTQFKPILQDIADDTVVQLGADKDQERQQEEEEQHIDFERIIMNQVNDIEEKQVKNNDMDAERIKLPREELTEEDQDLKEMFSMQLENLIHSLLLQIEPREKLRKARFDNHVKESANQILDIYLKEVDTIPEICDKVYAMGTAIGFKLGKLLESDSSERKKKSANGGNRGEQKLEKQIKELHQIVAKMSNELYRRRQPRKATKKEKEIIKKSRALIDNDITNFNLRNAREQWLDKLRHKKINLAKCEEKRRRKQDNFMFQQDQKGFFRTLEGEEAHDGEMTEMKKFIKSWGGIWERERERERERGKNPIYAMDGRNKKTTE